MWTNPTNTIKIGMIFKLKFRRMKRQLFFLLIILFFKTSYSQTIGDYQTKPEATRWSDVNAWQVYNGSNWVDATAIPTNSLATKPLKITIKAPAIEGSIFYMDSHTGDLKTTDLYIHDGVIFQQGVDQALVTYLSLNSMIIESGGMYRVPTTGLLSADQAANDATGGIRRQILYTQKDLVVSELEGVINPNPGKFIGIYTFTHTPDANGTLTSYTQQLRGYLGGYYGNGTHPAPSANVIYPPSGGSTWETQWFRYGTTLPPVKLPPAAVAGDYRTKANATKWSDVNSWQTYNGTAWENATVVPTMSLTIKPSKITIRTPATEGSIFYMDLGSYIVDLPTTDLYINDGVTFQQGTDQSFSSFLNMRNVIVNAGGTYTVPTTNSLSTDQVANNENNGTRNQLFFTQSDLIVSKSNGSVNRNPGKFIGLYTFTHTPDANGTLASYTQKLAGYTGTGAYPAPAVNVVYPPAVSLTDFEDSWTLNGTTLPSLTLPLRLISFEANLSLNTVRLNWTTDDEVGVSKFEIEKSKDGIIFETFSATVAKNTKTRNFYSISDANLTGGNTYYRLKMIDTDGSFVYSDVRAVNNKVISFLIFPNPVKDILKLQFPSVKVSGMLTVLNTMGQIVTTKKLDDNTTFLEIDIRNLNSGTYVIKIDIDGSTHAKQFIKL